MIRRDFCKSSLALAGLALRGERPEALSIPAEKLPKAPGLTKYVSEFIVNVKYEDIPENVIALGKKTILDGFGLALAGSASTAGPPIRQYIESLGPCGGDFSGIGTKKKIQPPLRAPAPGLFFPAECFDS